TGPSCSMDHVADATGHGVIVRSARGPGKSVIAWRQRRQGRRHGGGGGGADESDRAGMAAARRDDEARQPHRMVEGDAESLWGRAHRAVRRTGLDGALRAVAAMIMLSRRGWGRSEERQHCAEHERKSEHTSLHSNQKRARRPTTARV